MDKNLNEFIEHIESVSPDQTSVLFKNHKLNQCFLIMSIKGSHNKIMILNPEDDFCDIATILYAIRGNKTYIASIEVNEDYQQNGFGRLLFEIALAHTDLCGLTLAYGDVDPINSIKGVSNVEGTTYEDEKTALIAIYQKLGCTYNETTNRFHQKWKSGEKIKHANPLVLKIANILAEKDGFSLTDQNQPQ